ADEAPLPHAGLLHRLDRSLPIRGHAWDGELVGGDAVARAAVHHVEPQVIEAALRVGATAPATSQDGHVFLLGCVVTKPWSARLDATSRGRRLDGTSFP